MFYQILNLLGGNRPFFKRPGDSGVELDALKRFPPAISFYNHQRFFLYYFVGRKTPATGKTFSPPTDISSIIRETAVNDLVFQVTAERATHRSGEW